jgi:hypothetical protein
MRWLWITVFVAVVVIIFVVVFIGPIFLSLRALKVYQNRDKNEERSKLLLLGISLSLFASILWWMAVPISAIFRNSLVYIVLGTLAGQTLIALGVIVLLMFVKGSKKFVLWGATITLVQAILAVLGFSE